MNTYYRAIPSLDPASAVAALRLGGGWCHFDRIECLSRTAPPRIIPATDAPAEVLEALTAPRLGVGALSLDRPRLMGILNVTPDSFSDGGQLAGVADAVTAARAMVAQGADILDVGGESTRPGAAEIPANEETRRTAPVIEALRAAGVTTPVSIDTRKAAVAQAALQAGADIVNDVSGLQFDPALADVAAEAKAPVVLMHSQGLPATMQDDPRYGDALLDVYDALAAAIAQAEAKGIARARILVDPGIGFGKRDPHNLAILRRLSLYHTLGCPVLLGVSRKGFIGRIANIPQPNQRDSASAAIGLWAVGQGIQVLRSHDIMIHKQALALWGSLGADL